MPAFIYTAKTLEGKIQKGTISASSQQEAEKTLRKKSLTIISLAPKGKGSAAEIELEFLDRIGPKDVVFFARQLATMISASMPLAQSLRLLSSQTKSKKFQRAIDDIASEVEEGAGFADALAKYPKIFSGYFVGMVKTGESSGNLDNSLLYLAKQLETDHELKGKIIGAMIYPIAMVVMMVGIGALMMTVVLPPLIGIITESGQDIPFSTKILIGVSNFLTGYWWLAVLILIGLVIGIIYAKKTKQGAFYWCWLQLKLPVAGPLAQKIYVTRLSSSLATLMAGGLPILKALDLVRDVMNNQIFEDIVAQVAKDVEEGESVADSFAKHKDIPTVMSQMVRVGESTGKTDEVLLGLSKFYRKEVISLIKNLTSAIEPIMLIAMGIGAGILVSAVLLPIYQVSTSAGGM